MSGAEHLGEAMVRGVRVVRLIGQVRIDIDPAPAAPPDAAVDAEWDRRRALNPRLFDGPVLSVKGVEQHAGSAVIRCTLDSYKRLVVQPAVETGVRQLSITGVVTARNGAGLPCILLGRRSHRTRMYGGMWQNCPAGGIDPEPGAAAIDQRGLEAELLREVREEAGLDVKRIGSPVALIYDETARSHDLVVPVEVGAAPETTRGWEYDELRWVETGAVPAFEAAEGECIMAITRAIFRLMGWMG